MTTPYATKDQVKQRLSGDTPNFSDDFDTTIEAIILDISAEIDREVGKGRGNQGPFSFVADSVASTRYFNTAAGGVRYLPIDDCIEIESVTIYTNPGVGGQVLTVNTEYYPVQGLPILGLYRIGSLWGDRVIAGVGVSAKWGYAATCPADVNDAVIFEAIREFLSARAGNDDKVGSHVFGTVQIAKVFATKTKAMIDTYSYGGGSMRG